jgi:hypothetical protein
MNLIQLLLEREREKSELEFLHIKACLIFKKPVFNLNMSLRFGAMNLKAVKSTEHLNALILGSTALPIIFIAICI